MAGIGDIPHGGSPRSVAEALGQIVWILSQSPLHKKLPIEALEYSFMPALLKQQFRIFRFGPLPGMDDPGALAAAGISKAQIEQIPLGVAIWAYLGPEAEAKVERREHLQLEDWGSGDQAWLIELISPFANEENRLSEVMLADLAAGPFAGKPFKLHRTDPSGKRDTITVDEHLQAATTH